jgi:predicted amidohydrolase
VKLRVATSQLPVSADVSANARLIRRQMREARAAGAHVVHFCEGALSGYAGADLASFEGFDWAHLRAETEAILELAGTLRLWVLLGSAHPLTGRRKPHNSVYVIDDRGRLVDRYDKRFCAGPADASAGDLSHYTPGDHAVTFAIRGIRCGVLVCHEYRYPELYRDYKRRGVDLLFHSFHAGNISERALASMRAEVGARYHRLNRGTTYPEITMPAASQAAAASSHLWISCSNSSARYSCWPAFFVRGDGVVTGRLRRHATGLLVSTVDPEAPLYDSTRVWRKRAMRGVFHSGRTPEDPRSSSRRRL